ncbi:MAG: YkgJ family cysteine cluster protein [Filimonas sp.]|nr:YkgJ family cysteine cluster protein [Filimonas sp.]
MKLITDLEEIKQAALAKEAENDAFKDFLRANDNEATDSIVHQLNDEVSPQIDCVSCGNCCKSLMVNVEPDEADRLAAHLQMTREAFDEEYVEKGGGFGMMIINSVPCRFLDDTKCTVYEYRFTGCKEFPALHLPHFAKRSFTTFMHYDRCPIIFNVVEGLKERIGFIE